MILHFSFVCLKFTKLFNPDIRKQAGEVIISAKTAKPNHPSIIFNDSPVARKPFTKHLGLYLHVI